LPGYAPVPTNSEGPCRYTGLRHSLLYVTLNRPEVRERVRVAKLKAPGANRGKTLFHVGDMLAYLDSLADEQKGGAQ
jgi:hypothetical protein